MIIILILSFFPGTMQWIIPYWDDTIVNILVSSNMAAPIVQYVVVRGDLLHVLKWPLGAIITQACHASSAALHLFRNDSYTEKYTAELDHMHKVVLEVIFNFSILYCTLENVLSPNSHKLHYRPSTGRPVNIVTPVKFVTCRKNAQEHAIFTFK